MADILGLLCRGGNFGRKRAAPALVPATVPATRSIVSDDEISDDEITQEKNAKRQKTAIRSSLDFFARDSSLQETNPQPKKKKEKKHTIDVDHTRTDSQLNRKIEIR